jgi:hypothetical protein
MKTPKEITLCHLEVAVLPNGEVLCLGNTVGWVKQLGPYLRVAPKPKRAGSRGAPAR